MDINKKIRICKRPSIFITLKQIFIAVTVILSLIALVSLSFTVLRFMRVGEISVVGMSPYEKVDLLETLAIKRNQFWWALDEDELEEKLISERQLLSEVEVTKKLPNKLEIKIVESRTPRWYIDISGRKYALDGDMYVIEEVKNTDGVTKLVLPNVSEVFERKVPKFGQSETEIKKTLEIIDTVRSSDVRSRLTELDVSDRTNITMVIDGKYKVHLGGSDSLDGKLIMVKNVLNTEAVKNSKGGDIYAETYTEGGYASFKPNSGA
ncbi:MAG: FtsQ-type POTRA domain-containing protein [Clostridia bacterium]|nr:FtsQ-type POTRA domain-containing protein [Clostridia bacterium]